MSLDKIRQEIDKLDRKFVKLLKKRMDLALASKEYKTKIEDLDREEEIDANLKEMAINNQIDYDYLKRIYEIIFQEGKKKQNTD